MEQFSTFDIIKKLKIKRERLREWQKYRFVQPTIQEARGQGTRALFSRTDVYAVALFKRLVETGISRLRAAACAGEVYRKEASSAKYIIFAFDWHRNLAAVSARTGETDKGKRDVVTSDVKFVMNHVDLQKALTKGSSWGYVIVLDLEKLKREIDIILGQ